MARLELLEEAHDVTDDIDEVMTEDNGTVDELDDKLEDVPEIEDEPVDAEGANDVVATA